MYEVNCQLCKNKYVSEKMCSLPHVTRLSKSTRYLSDAMPVYSTEPEVHQVLDLDNIFDCSSRPSACLQQC